MSRAVILGEICRTRSARCSGHDGAETFEVRPLLGIEKAAGFHALEGPHIGSLTVEALLRDAEQQAIVANQCGLLLQNCGNRKNMLVPNAGGGEEFLGILRNIAGDLLFEQLGSIKPSASLKASMSAVLRAATSIWWKIT